MSPHRKPFNVLIALASGQAARGYGQRMLDGIIDFARTVDDWRFYFATYYRGEVGLLEQVPHWDGLLGLPERALQEQVEKGDKPGVIGAQRDESPLAQVYPDDPAVGRMAYDYFRDLGFTRLAFLGHEGAQFSDERMDAFLDAARRDGLGEVPTRKVQFDIEGVGEWMASQTFPCALFCANVYVARHAAISAEARGIRVPEDIAILGCDDDLHACELTWPPLSTIDHGARQIGYRSAEMLDVLLRGGEVAQRQQAVAPVRVIERHSTNTLAIDDPTVSEALHLIRAEACDGIEVAEVVDRVGASRRTLERAFRKHVNRGIREEIVRARVARAARLLIETDLPTPDVAAHAGFSSASKLSAVFRKETGSTPTAFRRSHRH
jgi:LacI family transcriptional regulator